MTNILIGSTRILGATAALLCNEIVGIVGISFLPGGDSSSSASAVSPDGTVVVGVSESSNGFEAFQWKKETGMKSLGFLPDVSGGLSSASSVSKQGDVIVGTSDAGLAGNRVAFVWTETVGMQLLQDVLETRFGLAQALAGWSLSETVDISADARTIIGRGINPNGDGEAWIVRLD